MRTRADDFAQPALAAADVLGMKLTAETSLIGPVGAALNQDDQIALLAWLSEALLPSLSMFSAPLLFATWRLGPGQEFPNEDPTYEGTERGVIVRAGSSAFADYLLLLDRGAWARARPITVASDGGRRLTYDVEPLQAEEVIDNGWQLDHVVDALVDAFSGRRDEGCEEHEGPCDPDEDGRREALALVARVAHLPGVVALRRRTQEVNRRFLASLGLPRTE